MAYITCAISGIKFHTDFFPKLAIPHTEGYYHPIFVAPYESLHHLYTAHCRGQLSSNDSYLLFIAFLHSSGAIAWTCPAACNPNEQRTKVLIENNLAQLIAVLEKSAVIRNPSFSQPSFKVYFDNASLVQIPNWIKAWEDNITKFNRGRVSLTAVEALQKVENRLTRLILGGQPEEKYAGVIASWADKAAEFPAVKKELWKQTICSCFSITKMFNTPLPLLAEIKDYCECNIEAGSIHFHTLSKVLKEGMARHLDYLGGSSLALGYTLLPPEQLSIEEAKTAASMARILAKAPLEEPQRCDYPTSLAHLRAKLAYKAACNKAEEAATKLNL